MCYLNCVLHNYIKYIHHCIHNSLILNHMIHCIIILYVLMKANIAQFCGQVEMIVGWINYGRKR